MKYLPENWETDPVDARLVVEIQDTKSMCEQGLGKLEDSQKSFNYARSIRPDLSLLSGFSFDASLKAYSLDEDPSKFFDVVESWTDKERNLWLRCLFNYASKFAPGVLTLGSHVEYAKAVRKRGTNCLLNWCEEYIKTLPPGSAQMIAPRGQIAQAYVIADMYPKAIDALMELFSLEFKNDDIEDRDALLDRERMNLAAMIFHQFRVTTDPHGKLELLEKMKKLRDFSIGPKNDVVLDGTGLSDSQSGLMLAIMTRTIGSPIEYYSMMEASFKVCLDGLTDKDGGNDSSSFRLLAKVLACMPGLERDAQTALSCQFSIADPDIDHDAEQEDIDINEKAEEDLLPDAQRLVGCDGPCGKSMEDWSSGAWYLCLQCADVDLCKDCYEVSVGQRLDVKCLCANAFRR
jgi:hypothetical protein